MEVINTQQWLKKLYLSIESAQCKVGHLKVTLTEGFKKTSDLFKNAIKCQKSVWWIGNGGSAAICSHLSQDMMNKLGIKSYYLNDSSLMTCMANDYGFKSVYSRPLMIHSLKNDILIAISSSGNSENIISCVEMANEKGLKVITLTGMEKNNRLLNMKSNISYYVPSSLYGIIEVSHEAILHGIVETLYLELENSRVQ